MMYQRISSLSLCAVSAVVLVFILGCSSLPQDTEIEHWKIEGIPGPEDIVVDTSGGVSRLLVSSSDRRGRGIPGEIFTVGCSTLEKTVLPRKGGPQGSTFNPHGLSLTLDESGRTLLYVINHASDKEGEKTIRSVLVYTVEPDRLVLEETLKSPLLTSPNDLFALPDGTVYVSNDSSAEGGLMELILGLKRSTVVRYDPPLRRMVRSDRQTGYGKRYLYRERVSLSRGNPGKCGVPVSFPFGRRPRGTGKTGRGKKRRQHYKLR